jgi:hypothetical protein
LFLARRVASLAQWQTPRVLAYGTNPRAVSCPLSPVANATGSWTWHLHDPPCLSCRPCGLLACLVVPVALLCVMSCLWPSGVSCRSYGLLACCAVSLAFLRVASRCVTCLLARRVVSLTQWQTPRVFAYGMNPRAVSRSLSPVANATGSWTWHLHPSCVSSCCIICLLPSPCSILLARRVVSLAQRQTPRVFAYGMNPRAVSRSLSPVANATGSWMRHLHPSS